MIKRLLAVCAFGCALALGGVAGAQGTMPTSWTSYVPKNDTAMPALSQAEAADTYLQILKQRALPTNDGRCWRYYWNAGSSGPSTDAKWTNGVLSTGCTWPQAGVGSTADNTAGIAVPLSCTATSADERCALTYSRATQENAGPSCSAGGVKPAGQASCGNPINIGTANKYQVETDFEVPGSPWLSFTRYYNSQAARARGAAMGYRWRHSLEYELHFRSGGVAALLRPDGSVRTYGGSGPVNPASRGTVSPVLDTGGQIVGYAFNDEEGSIETYNANGAIQRIDFRQGGFLVFSYGVGSLKPTQVSDHFGRSLSFGYDTSGRITSVTTPAGAAYGYTYDTNDRLVTRVTPDNKTRTYGYDSTISAPTTYQRGMLTSITDETNTVIGKYAYDSKGRAISTEGAAGVNKFAVAYGTTSTSVTSALGAITQYTFETLLGTPRVVGTTTSCPNGTCAAVNGTAATYDVNGNVASSTSADGVKVCMAYDLSRNLLARKVEGLAATADCAAALAGGVAAPASLTTITWNSTFRLPDQVSGPKQRQSFVYDTAGRLISRTVTATADETGSQGLNATAVGAARTDQVAYNDFGQVTTHTGPRTDVLDVTTYAYGPAGVLVSETNALGQAVLYSDHDADGRARTVTLPNGTVTQLVYDARGQLTTSTISGETTTYAYYANGRVLSVTQPSGESETYVYDAAGRVTKVTDQRGNTRNLSYNLANSVTLEQTKTSTGTVVSATTQVFDALNRVTKMSGAHALVPQPAPYTP